MQKLLSAEQVEAFHHDLFVEDQARHFESLVDAKGGTVVADIGGGCGHFAQRLMRHTHHKVRVIDVDSASVNICRAAGVDAVQGDALSPQVVGDETIVCFNLILHHLIAASEKETLALQTQALALWRPSVQAIFVNEYIYESFFGNLSGRLIFNITKSPLLSWMGQIVARAVPSLRANTFGVGVRFRAREEWIRVFEAAGFTVKSSVVGDDEPISLPRRILLIKHIRRDSFLLEPKLAGEMPNGASCA